MSGLRMQEDRRRKLIASARLLESDQSGERLAAVEAMLRLLPSGATVADMLDRALAVAGSARPSAACFRPDPAPSLRRWQRKARTLSKFPEHLNDREISFIADMAVRTSEPSPKQFDWLNNLAARVEAKGGL